VVLTEEELNKVLLPCWTRLFIYKGFADGGGEAQGWNNGKGDGAGAVQEDAEQRKAAGSDVQQG